MPHSQTSLLAYESLQAAQRGHLQLRSNREETISRPLPVVVLSTYELPTLVQLLFCNELRKDAFDGGEKRIGSHTFIIVFPSFAAEPLWLCPDIDSWNSLFLELQWNGNTEHGPLFQHFYCGPYPVLSALRVLTHLILKILLEPIRKILFL